MFANWSWHALSIKPDSIRKQNDSIPIGDSSRKFRIADIVTFVLMIFDFRFKLKQNNKKHDKLVIDSPTSHSSACSFAETNRRSIIDYNRRSEKRRRPVAPPTRPCRAWRRRRWRRRGLSRPAPCPPCAGRRPHRDRRWWRGARPQPPPAPPYWRTSSHCQPIRAAVTRSQPIRAVVTRSLRLHHLTDERAAAANQSERPLQPTDRHRCYAQ